MRSQPKPKKASSLVTNGAAATITSAVLQGVTFNAKTKLVRNDTMEGRQFKVVPMVMMTEGVHAGSNGPLYYPKEELAKTPAVWNHKPVVVYHPTINGQGVSACDPTILTTHKIGVIMNTKFDKLGRLTAEAWIEEDRANAVDVRIMEAINENKMMELSTGLFTDNEDSVGEWEGEAYTQIARNYRPDHLAVLPDKTGACSMADGAGFIRNEVEKQFPKATKELLQAGALAMLRQFGVEKLTDNELSLDNVRSQLWGLIREKLYPSKNTLGSVTPDVWIEDVYATFFVYSFGGKLFKLGYANNGTKVELEGEPSEVVRVTEYRTAEGAFVGNQQPKPVIITMNKTEVINGLIANAASGWKETDREFLTGLTDERLNVIANAVKAPAAPAQTSAPVAPVAPALNAQDQEALNYGKQQLATNKAKLVAVIVANKANRFSEAVLNAKGIEELEGLAALAAAPAVVTERPPSFFGQAPVAPVGNASPDADMLVAPQMTFGK